MTVTHSPRPFLSIQNSNPVWKDDPCERTHSFCVFDGTPQDPLIYTGSERRIIRGIWICPKCKRLSLRDVSAALDWLGSKMPPLWFRIKVSLRCAYQQWKRTWRMWG